jgi:hypothetical protein
MKAMNKEEWDEVCLSRDEAKDLLRILGDELDSSLVLNVTIEVATTNGYRDVTCLLQLADKKVKYTIKG